MMLGPSTECRQSGGILKWQSDKRTAICVKCGTKISSGGWSAENFKHHCIDVMHKPNTGNSTKSTRERLWQQKGKLAAICLWPMHALCWDADSRGQHMFKSLAVYLRKEQLYKFCLHRTTIRLFRCRGFLPFMLKLKYCYWEICPDPGLCCVPG